MKSVPAGVTGAVLAAVLLSGCGSEVGQAAGGATVTVTGAAVTHTAEAVTSTPAAETVSGPTQTHTAPAVTVTAQPTGTDASSAAGEPGGALEALASLPVKGRAPKTDYTRDQFGPAWTDAVTVNGGRNGCDTRNDILRRDLVDVVVEAGTAGCVALVGVLPDPYSGEHLPFERGTDAGSRIEIDHVVSLSNAWQTGAQQLSPEARRDFANDPLNLLAVSGSTNRQKSDADAATWLPPNRSYRCPMVARQLAVKAKYGLWVTPPEADAARRVLGSCPAEPIPTDHGTQVPPTA